MGRWSDPPASNDDWHVGDGGGDRLAALLIEHNPAINYDACGDRGRHDLEIPRKMVCATENCVCPKMSPRCWPDLQRRCNTTIFRGMSETTAKTSCWIRWHVRSPDTGARRRNSSPRWRRGWRNP